MIPVPSGAVRLQRDRRRDGLPCRGAMYGLRAVERESFGAWLAPGGFANGFWNLFRFTFAESYTALLVTNNDKCSEAKALTTLKRFWKRG